MVHAACDIISLSLPLSLLIDKSAAARNAKTGERVHRRLCVGQISVTYGSPRTGELRSDDVSHRSRRRRIKNAAARGNVGEIV